MAYSLINIGTPNGNNGDTIRDAFKKSNDNDAYLKTKVDAFANSPPGVVKANGVVTLTPIDARLSINYSSQVGAIKIKLPQSYTSTMLKLNIEVLDHALHEAITLKLAGYNHQSLKWLNTSAQIIASKPDRDFMVRFGHDGDKCCIYIGELNSVWDYPKIAVTLGMFGFGSYYYYSYWLSGWNISLETSIFQNVTQTHGNNLIVSQ